MEFHDEKMEQIYFGQRIAQLRRERGMTQEELANQSGRCPCCP